MSEFKSLNGYAVKDATARRIISQNQRNFILISDSYGMCTTPNWLTYFNNNLSVISYKGTSGAGFIAGTTFYEILSNIIATLSDEQKETVTDIVVCGGWNDAQECYSGGKTSDDLILAVKNFVDLVNANFPYAIPHIGFIGWQTYKCTRTTNTKFQLLTTCEVYKRIRYKNLHYLDNVEYIMRSPKYMGSDYMHPNTNGAYQLYLGISRSLFGGYTFHEREVINNSLYDVVNISCTGKPTFNVMSENSLLKFCTEAHITGINCTITNKSMYIIKFKDNAPIETNSQQILNVLFIGTINGTYYFQVPLHAHLTQHGINVQFPSTGAITGGIIVIDGIVERC